ncbi:MAG: polyprenyl synthetase family protein [Planctomycetota bacterium]|nr:polyprenyl synthetase family protein [Planctomycetota bacterium]
MTAATGMTLQDIYAPVQDDLQRVEELLDRELSAHSGKIKDLLDHVTSFRGKRMRPALALLAGKCFDRVDTAHIYAGSVMELIHSATLVHDDILDEAQIRRGIPTISAIWGTEISVLLGDYIFSRAFAVIAEFDGSVCLPYITRTTDKMCEGELIQLKSRYDLDLTEEMYLKIAELKTASLCALSTQLGALLAGADRDSVDSFYEFGLKLGLAFQITDDCLDITGEEDIVGKSLGTDLGQGKLTLPAIRLLQRLDGDRRNEIKALMQDGLSDESRPLFRELIQEYCTVESSLDTAGALIEEGWQRLEDVPDSDAKQGLRALGEYILSRDL